MSEKTPQEKTPQLRWEDIPDTMPDDGCVLFKKYDPDLLREDDQGCLPERRGPVRQTPSRESSRAPTTPKRIVKGVSKLVFLILFALSQCGATTPQPNHDDPQTDSLPAKE